VAIATLAVLAMLLKADVVAYTVSVALATAIVWIIFTIWRRFVWMPLSVASDAPAHAPSTQNSSGCPGVPPESTLLLCFSLQ